MVSTDQFFERENLTSRNQIYREIIEAGFFVSLLAFILIFVLAGTFTFGGIESRFLFDTGSFYTAFLVGGVLIILTFHIIAIVSRASLRGSNKAKLPFRSFIFDPETAPLPNLDILGFKPFKWMFNPIHVIVIFSSFFALLGLLSAVSPYAQFTFIPVQSFEQQLTPTGELILAVEPGASSETFGIGSVAIIFYSLLILLLSLGVINTFVFYLFQYAVIPPIIGLLGVLLHVARYGSEEGALSFTWIFWTSGTILMFVTGSIIIFWIWHFFNNALNKGKDLFSNDQIIFTVLGTIFSVLIIYFMLYFLFFRKLEKKLIEMGFIGQPS